MHKYLKDNNIPLNILPENYFSGENDNREEYWDEQRKIYGFDEKETWNLNDYFFLWFFERLSMFNDVNNIATSSEYEKIDLHDNSGHMITFQEAIDELLELSKWLILNDGTDLKDMTFAQFNEVWQKKYDRFMVLFKETLPKLWW